MRSLRAVVISGTVFAILGCSSGLHYTYPPPYTPHPVLDMGAVQHTGTGEPPVSHHPPPPEITPREQEQQTAEQESSSAQKTLGRPGMASGSDADMNPSAGSPLGCEALRPQVKAWVERLSGKRRSTFLADLERLETVRPTIERIFSEHGIPRELSYLCLVESGARAKAVSPSGAVGYWQFMPETARRFGLQVNRYVDERTNLEKSTRAAALYLKHLYAMFGDWYLVIAAYNAGEGALKRLMDEHGITSFWDMHERMAIKCETIDFVPKYIATLILASQNGDRGLSGAYGGLAAGGYVNGVVSTSALEDKRLALARPVTMTDAPPGVRPDRLARSANPDDAPEGETPTPPAHQRRYVVRGGDTLYSIAKRHGTTVEVLAQANGLKKPASIRKGMRLLIPAPEDGSRTAGPSTRRTTSQQPAGEADAEKTPATARYTVKKGDTLWAIARSFGADPSDIRRENGIAPGGVIRPGDVLTIRMR